MLSWTMSRSSDDCLRQLEWPSLKLCFLSVNKLYDIISNEITIKISDFCSFVTSCTRQHSLSIFSLQSTINSLQQLFFGSIPFKWNKIPFSILSLSNRNAFRRAVKCYFLVLCNLFYCECLLYSIAFCMCVVVYAVCCCN